MFSSPNCCMESPVLPKNIQKYYTRCGVLTASWQVVRFCSVVVGGYMDSRSK